jgi:hypothetical protein
MALQTACNNTRSLSAVGASCRHTSDTRTSCCLFAATVRSEVAPLGSPRLGSACLGSAASQPQGTSSADRVRHSPFARNYAEARVRDQERHWDSFPPSIKNAVFWDVTPCGSRGNWSFGGIYRLHHQGDKNRRALLHHVSKVIPDQSKAVALACKPNLEDRVSVTGRSSYTPKHWVHFSTRDMMVGLRWRCSNTHIHVAEITKSEDFPCLGLWSRAVW